MAVQRPITNWDDVPVIIDVPYAARLYGINADRACRLCRAGKLPAFKVGKLWRLRREDVIKDINNKLNKREIDSNCTD